MKKSIMASLLLAATLFSSDMAAQEKYVYNEFYFQRSSSCRWGRKTSFFSATARLTVANGTNCSG
uniref:hypothetical protein n=1 Tax=Candidatus Limisoma sp. TaxID=3076476 RepID=UPI003FF12DB5